MTNNKQINAVVKYIYTGEIGDEEITMNDENFKRYETIIKQQLDELFLANDGRTENGMLIEFKVKVR